jgi:hypothetical protein
MTGWIQSKDTDGRMVVGKRLEKRLRGIVRKWEDTINIDLSEEDVRRGKLGQNRAQRRASSISGVEPLGSAVTKRCAETSEARTSFTPVSNFR